MIHFFTNSSGNYVLIHCKINTDSYVIGSIYGPNKDEPQFYRQVDDVLENVDCDHIVIGGDFNFIMDAEKDCYGYAREHNVNDRREFKYICNKHSLIDIWREQNPNSNIFTWYASNQSKGSRLDMFFY